MNIRGSINAVLSAKSPISVAQMSSALGIDRQAIEEFARGGELPLSQIEKLLVYLGYRLVR